MKTNKSLFVLIGVMLLTSVGIAHAADDRQIWRDTEGQIVHDSWGTCVRSRWIIDHDPCAPSQPEKIVWTPPPPTHTIIAQEDRTVYFPFNKTYLTGESKQKLDTLANRLTTADDVTGAKVVGYADRIGTTSYNEALSKKRAETVLSYLIGQGFVKPSVTKTHWVGKSEPSPNCPDNLPRTQLLECLQPDRKVQVDINYRAETQASR